MNSTNDGGPAFPRTGSEVQPSQEGMSLRAYLAGQAIGPMIQAQLAMQSSMSKIKLSPKDAAQHAVDIADALIKELNK